MLEAINEQVTALLCVDSETVHWKWPMLVHDLVNLLRQKPVGGQAIGVTQKVTDVSSLSGPYSVTGRGRINEHQEYLYILWKCVRNK